MARLEGKVAIVTGSAGGIGEATAKLFAQEGAKVVIADIKAEEGKKVAQEIRQAGGEAFYYFLNVTSEEHWQGLMAATIERYGKLNVLVNNAGIGVLADVDEETLEGWHRTIEVNATGVFLGIKYAVMKMKDNGEPCSIINRSSIDGMVAEPGHISYCASKGAVRLITKAAALDCGLKGYNIRVNSVHPGYIPTPINVQMALRQGGSIEEFYNKMAKLHPIGRVGRPIDIAYLDVYLASDESSWTTGAEFVIDGGYTIV